MNITSVPYLTPIRFVPLNSDNMLSFDGALFSEQIRSWQDQVMYYQKQCLGDTIRFQVQTNLTPVRLNIIDCQQRSYGTFDAVVKPTNIVAPETLTYEFNFQLTPDFTIGQVFYFLLTFGEAGQEAYVPWISEPQVIVPDDDTTSLIEYTNSFNHQNVVFDTGIVYNFRVESNLQNLDPLTYDAVFQDQPMNLRTIKSIPYDQWLFILGPAQGVPDWVARLVRSIWTLDTVKYHGIQYTKPDGQKWTATGLDNNYPLRGWTCVLQNTLNHYSTRTEDNNSPAESFTVVWNLNTDAFGTLNDIPSNTPIRITKIGQ